MKPSRFGALALLALMVAVMLPSSSLASSSHMGAHQLTDVNYASKANWTCRPDIAAPQNPCLGDLDITSVSGSGALRVQRVHVAKHAKADCFYVYPTIVPGFGNAPLSEERKEALRITQLQVAEFSQVCNVYAPLYGSSEQSVPPAAEPGTYRVAGANVEAAFSYFLSVDSGRPFVLIGDSQGAILLNQVVERVEADAALRSRLVSAVLLGDPFLEYQSSAQNPSATVLGLPACTSAEQFGCVIGYSSFSASAPPTLSALFGHADGAGPLFGTPNGSGQVVCVNPAQLDTASSLKPILVVSNPPDSLPFYRYAIWSSREKVRDRRIKTPFVTLPSFASGSCVAQNPYFYLSIQFANSSGPRARSVPSQYIDPDDGLHAFDMTLALGNLIDIVRNQVEAIPQGA